MSRQGVPGESHRVSGGGRSVGKLSPSVLENCISSYFSCFDPDYKSMLSWSRVQKQVVQK